MPESEKDKLDHKHNTIAIMSEMVKLRAAIQNKPMTDEEVFNEAMATMTKTGTFMTKAMKKR